MPGLKPLQIAAAAADAEAVTVRLKDWSRFARVHLFATRYVPAVPPFESFGKVRDAEPAGVVPVRPESVYLTGRNIGDEYRYVLDRRGMKKFPGNMLDRPQLLLDPWAVRSTETGEQAARGGEAFGARGRPKGTEAMPSPASPPPAARAAAAATAGFANLDFLADPTVVLTNLVPDENGVVRIDRRRLGGHALVTAVAVDPLTVTVRTVGLPEQSVKFVDLRLKDGFDPRAHFTQQKRVSVLEPGKPFVIADVGGSRFESYDSLAKVHALYSTLSKDPKLAEFAFVLTWPKLKGAEKRELYSRHACHELHFFLKMKDPAFFAVVVRPYLAHKRDKTFLDHWLLDRDVSRYLDPWEHARLNTAERVLVGRRVPGEGPKTARHLADLLSLVPPDAGRDLALFDGALQNADLAADDPVAVKYRRAKDATKLAAEKEMFVLGGLTDSEKAGPLAGSGGAPGSGVAGRPAGNAADGPARGKPEPAAAEAQANLGLALRESGARGGRTGKTRTDEKSDEDAPADRFLRDVDGDARAFHEDDRKRAAVRQLYRKLDPTMEWAENNYYHLRINQQTAGLVSVGPFWAEYARHGDGPFLSRHVADAGRSFTEMMFALSVLDLPFESPKHTVAFDGPKMTVTPSGPVIAFHEEVRPADGPDGKTPVVIGQNYYRPSDRFREENGERVDKYVTGEYLVHTVYGCQVAITNPTSTRQRLSALVQLPLGAIPLANGQFTRTVAIDLEPYRTQTVDYQFYFPAAGRFTHFPAQVAKAEKVVAAAAPATLDVLEKPSRPDTTSWDYVSQHGTDDEVVALLARENVHALNLGKVAFRMRDREFFGRVTALLRERHAYHPTLWSYALLHNAAPVAKEFLAHHDGLAARCGGPIDTPLLTADPVARHAYEHLEYKPLVNARAHALGSRRQVVNGPLHDQYHKMLKTLTYRNALGDADLLAVVYYLLLQDRIEEARAAFARVSAEKVETKLQYDYCAAYLALFDEDAARARSIAARYAAHPVDRWRSAFAAVVAHLDEAAGKGQRVADADDKGHLAATEPAVDLTVTAAGVHLTWQNVETVTLSYVPMDVELLFSRTPFASQAGRQLAFTKPAAAHTLKLPAGKTKVTVPVPDELLKRNMLVQVSTAGKTKVAPYFAAEMDVKVTENYGQLRVTDSAGAKPLSKVYVKVYARLADGSVKFHRDGYTDARGRFDYASVNTPERQPVERFAVLVLSDDRGAVIREAAPPQQ